MDFANAIHDAGTPQNGTPPYLPFRTLFNFIERLQETTIPARIDRSYWGRSMSGAMGSQLTGGLGFLGLINDLKEPTQVLEEIVEAEGEERKQIMREALQRAYAPILVSIDRLTRGQLNDRFAKAYPAVSGSSLKKATSFFIHAAEYADLPLSAHIKSKSMPDRRPRVKRTGTPKSAAKQSTAPPVGEPQAPAPTAMPSLPLAHESLLLWGLFHRLPKPGSVWPEALQEQWLATLKNVFAMEYRQSE